jgi:TonB family protein
MRTKVLAAAFTILFAHTIATAAPAPALLAPTGPWNVEFADSMCLLGRPYGKDGALNLLLKPSMVGDNLEIIVTRATTASASGEIGRAVLAIAGHKIGGDAFFTAYSTANSRLLRVRVAEDKIAMSAIHETLAIDAGGESRHLFAVPGIERALPVLSECVQQLRAIYKISETDLAAIVTKPELNASGFFSFNDYPREALNKGQSGTVGVLIWIESNGRVSSCEIVETSSAPSLDQTTCEMYKRRGRFRSARNAAGTAVRAPMFTRVSWTMPSPD